ncbi:MAG: NAD-dependent epimerase/dehydratase family protein [Candidatus Eremiobacteraeota bacterium]|nr:NAD-dependent epimerase/dehydratase family protein [Candidatus Eremiobacteraeota bacterium]
MRGHCVQHPDRISRAPLPHVRPRHRRHAARRARTERPSVKRIGITGVAGFIGSNLADRLLSAGYDVVGYDNLAYGVREQVPDGVEFYEVDVRGREIYDLFERVDVLFHLAAKNCIADCQEDPVETADVNVTGTVNVFEAARQAGVGKIVYAESSALYEGSQSLPTPESDVCPESFYATSKLAGMAFAQAYRRFFETRTTALRYFCVYGPRQDYRRTIPPVMSAFIINLLRGRRPVIYGTGEKRRDFVYVDDVNDFHLRCIEDRATDGHTFNLGSGVNYSIGELFAIVADLLGSNLQPEYRPDLPGEARENLADISAARALGWEPRTGLREGLRRSVAYIKGELSKIA